MNLKSKLFLPILIAILTSYHAYSVSIYNLKYKEIDGKEDSFAKYKGKAMLIFNMATHCGRTPQLAKIQELSAKYKNKGLEVIGIPSNDFGGQAPESNKEILNFSQSKYKTDFSYLEKSIAKGKDIDPIFQHLVAETGGKEIQWNFEKFIVDRSGKVIKRFASGVTPDDPEVIKAIEIALK